MAELRRPLPNLQRTRHAGVLAGNERRRTALSTLRRVRHCRVLSAPSLYRLLEQHADVAYRVRSRHGVYVQRRAQSRASVLSYARAVRGRVDRSRRRPAHFVEHRRCRRPGDRYRSGRARRSSSGKSTTNSRCRCSGSSRKASSQAGNFTDAVPNTRVSFAALLTVRSIIDGAGVRVDVGHDAADLIRVIDDHRRAKHGVDVENLRVRRPAVNHRDEKALAHDAGHQCAGESFRPGRFVVGEARSIPTRRTREAAHVVHAGVRCEHRQLRAELDVG